MAHRIGQGHFAGAHHLNPSSMLHQASQEAGCTPSIVGDTITRDCAGEKLSSSMTIKSFADNNSHQAWLPLEKIRKISQPPTGREDPTTDRDNGSRGTID
jgi:hypothetical protein